MNKCRETRNEGLAKYLSQSKESKEKSRVQAAGRKTKLNQNITAKQEKYRSELT